MTYHLGSADDFSQPIKLARRNSSGSVDVAMAEKEKERVKEPVPVEVIAAKFQDQATGVAVQDRTYLLTTYPQCFVGTLMRIVLPLKSDPEQVARPWTGSSATILRLLALRQSK